MGMAASQARHLALVARKSNCEYEGQQINQARTALANQSANLFNQMLGLSVPVPPSTQDFTKIQYSFTDGIHGSTIDSWKQLATPEEEYNYVVTHHYNAEVYTGSQKKLADPQVQYSIGLAKNPTEMSEIMTTLTSSRVEYDKIIDEYNNIQENYNNALAAQKAADEAYQAALQKQQEATTARDTALENYNNAKAATADFIKEGGAYDTLSKAIKTAEEQLEAARIAPSDKTNYKSDTSNYTAGNIEHTTYDLYTNGDDQYYRFGSLTNPSDFTYVTSEEITNAVNVLKEKGALPENFDINNDIYISKLDSNPKLVFRTDLETAYINSGAGTAGSFDRYDIKGESSIEKKSEALQTDLITKQNAYETALVAFEPYKNQYAELQIAESEMQIAYNSAEAILTEADLALATSQVTKSKANEAFAQADAAREEAETKYGKTITDYETALDIFKKAQTPEYLGNCKLTYLENLTEDQATELKQVVTTMKELEINPAINDCFDDKGNYLGGVYEFKLNGTTYYTSFAELSESFNSGTGNNHIDGQTKLNYYNAENVQTKIEKTEKALLETDGNGRFTSVRFEDNTITYNLSMETITDKAAYDDAMNQYNYENAIYDKTIQDINAKTSIIQRQDQQLELRLKQLDTEHSALVAEIEAVSKVVKDNVDSTFKTFGG